MRGLHKRAVIRKEPDNEMRICFGSASKENIRKGIARPGKVLKKFV